MVYEELLSILADPDYGDITDPVSGRDVQVEVKMQKKLVSHIQQQRLG